VKTPKQTKRRSGGKTLSRADWLAKTVQTRSFRATTLSGVAIRAAATDDDTTITATARYLSETGTTRTTCVPARFG